MTLHLLKVHYRKGFRGNRMQIKRATFIQKLKTKEASTRPTILSEHRCQVFSKRHKIGLPGGSEVKASACNVEDLGSIPGSGRSPGEGNGNPFQYSHLENPTDGGAWWATVHGVTKSRARLSDFTHSQNRATQHLVPSLHG